MCACTDFASLGAFTLCKQLALGRQWCPWCKVAGVTYRSGRMRACTDFTLAGAFSLCERLAGGRRGITSWRRRVMAAFGGIASWWHYSVMGVSL